MGYKTRASSSRTCSCLHPKKFLKIGDSGPVAVSDGQMLKAYFFAAAARQNPQHIPRKNLTNSIYKFIMRI